MNALPNPFVPDSATFADAATALLTPGSVVAALNSNLPDALPVGSTLAGVGVSDVSLTAEPTPAIFSSIMRAISEELADELRTINEPILLRQFGERT